MNKILRQAQELQSRLAKAQAELADMTVEATAGGGVVKVVVNGQHKVQSVTISPEVVNPQDVEMLQDLVLSAINEGITKAEEMAAKHLEKVTGVLKIPGM